MIITKQEAKQEIQKLVEKYQRIVEAGLTQQYLLFLSVKFRI